MPLKQKLTEKMREFQEQAQRKGVLFPVINGVIMMTHKLKLLIAGSFLALMAGGASAAMVATTADDISVRSGPGEEYEEVGLATRGSSGVLDGCLEGSSWCRMDINGMRGWVYAEQLNVMYEGSPVVLEQHMSELDVPVVAFEKTGSINVPQPGPGDEKLGRVEDIDAITPPENIITYMDQNPAQEVEVQGDVVIGSAVPAEAPLIAIPDYQYRYVRVNNVPVLVEPESRRIVYIYQ
jgi:uncharacterized protein YraI